MAAIDTLSGITLVDNKHYEVTSVVDIGSGIDDVTDAVFEMHTGGLLRWVSGCTTTFTRCIFIETGTAQALGSDNFNSSAADDFLNNRGKARFHETGGTSDHGFCAPIFKGCTWKLYNDIRSDFDVGLYPASAAPTFERDEHGSPCFIYSRTDDPNGSFNHFASSYQVIDGLVMDHTGTGAFEFAAIPSNPDQFKNLTVVDNSPGSTSRHIVVLMQNVPAGGSRTLKRLKGRNIALYGGDETRVVRLVDTIGSLPSAEDSGASDSYGSTGRYYRTVASNYINSSNADVDARTVIVDSSNTVVSDSAGTSYSYELLQYERLGGTIPLVAQGAYTIAKCGWGYGSQRESLTLADQTDPDYYVGSNTVLFEDTNITEAVRDTVAAYSSIADANQLYDYCRYVEQTRLDYPQHIGVPFVSASGGTIDFGAYDVVFDPTLPLTFTHIPNDISGSGTPGVVSLVGSIQFNDDTNKDTGFSLTVEAGSVFEDISASYTSKNWVIASTVWKDDGTKVVLHILATYGDETNSFVQYDLSTPWDISTATFGSRHTQFMNGQPCDFWIHPDGTQIIVAKRWNRWYTGTMSTPWDVSTIGSLTGVYSNPEFDRCSNVLFNSDGTVMWSNRDGGNWSTSFQIRRWNLSTPYDITTRDTYTEYSLIGRIPYGFIDNSYQRTMKWWNDGKYLTFCNAGGSTIYFREMTTPYDFDEVTGVSDFTAISVPVNHNSKTVGSALVIDPDYSARLLFHYHSDDNNVFKMQYRNVGATFVTGGASNTVYVNSTALASTSNFDTIQTTGTISLLNGATTGMQLVDVNGVVTTVTVNGINPNTEVRMYRVSDDVEIGGIENSTGTSASINYTYTTPVDMYIVIHSEQYTTSPRYIEFTTQSAPATLTVFQSKDRAFKNPL